MDKEGTNVSPIILRKGGGERREAKEGGMDEGRKGEGKEKRERVGNRERASRPALQRPCMRWIIHNL